MKELRFLLLALCITMFTINCSNDENETTLPNVISKNTSSPRSFPIKDVLFPSSPEDLDYVNNIKDKVLEDNPLLIQLSNNTLYFGEIMWEVPKIIRNEDHGVVYTFIPVFDPTYYQVSYFFGIKDIDGALTYLIESKNYINYQVENNMLSYNIANGANILEYFDYNFGFTEGLTYHNPFEDEGAIDDGVQEFGLDCFSTSYTDVIICTCGANHTPEEIGICNCNNPGYSCGCPSTSSSTFIDCWGEPMGSDGGTGPSVNGGNNGSSSTFHDKPFLAALTKYLDELTGYQVMMLANTPCEATLEQYYAQVEGLPYGNPIVASVNCAVQQLEVTASGGCNTVLPPALENFDYSSIDKELIEWVHAYGLPPIENPICGMIVAGYTGDEISSYLSFLKISLENEPDPGYDDDDVPDPYSPYNIDNTWQKTNKVTQFLKDYPCVESGDSYGLLLSKPAVVDWAIGFLDGDCGNESKTNYTTVVFNALKLDDEFVPERFSELYAFFTSSDDNILLADCTYDITPWIDLASFVIPDEVNARLESLGWENQDIDAEDFWAMESSKVNLDYHSVKIDQLPDLDGDGIATPEELFDEIRLNLPDYADGQLTVEVEGPDFDVATTWGFYGNDFDDYWNTPNAQKAILEIDTESNPDGFGSSWLATGITDDATVICSSFEDECCWVFSTVWVQDSGISDNGSHPVSGNRQFGLKDLGNGKYEFYIKAADRARISWSVAALGVIFGKNNAVDIFFQITDKSWNNLTNNIVEMINNPPGGNISGIATQNTPITIRPRWNEVRDKLKSEYPLTIIPCDE